MARSPRQPQPGWKTPRYFFAASVFFVAAAAPVAHGALHRVVVPHPARQASAGVFRVSDGALVRALWAGRSLDAGELLLDDGEGDGGDNGGGNDNNGGGSSGAPGGKDGNGHGGVEVRVQVSNVTYAWEGVVGNTAPPTGRNTMSSLTPPQGLASHRGLLFFALGYNEAQTGLKMVRAGAVAAAVAAAPGGGVNVNGGGGSGTLGAEGWWQMGHADPTTVFTHVATDGARLYAANEGECVLPKPPPPHAPPPRPGPAKCGGIFGSSPQSFVVALNLRTRDFCEHNFTAGDGMVGVCRYDQGHFGCDPDATIDHNTCNGGGNECFDGCASFGWMWSSAVDSNPDNSSQTDPATGQPVARLADAPSGIAVERVDTRGRLLFVAHEHRNEIRVFDAVSGARVGTVPSPGPRALAVSMPGQTYEMSVLWVVERANETLGSPLRRRRATASNATHVVRKYTSTRDQWQNGTFVPTQVTLPGVGLPLDVSTVQSAEGSRSGVPIQYGVVVADGATQQLRVFDASGKPISAVGRAGGHDDGNPAVRDDVFMWRTGPSRTLDDFHAAVACDDDGSVAVTDGGNRRVLRFNVSTGALIGRPMQYSPVSYVSTTAYTNATRVFANFLEFEVDDDAADAAAATAADAAAANDGIAHGDAGGGCSAPSPPPPSPASPSFGPSSWRLVRNWAAGLDFSLRSRLPAWDGFHAVADLPGGGALGMVECNGSSPCDAVLELPAGGSGPARVVAIFNASTFPWGASPMIHAGGALRYMNETSGGAWPAATTQRVYEAAYDSARGGWDLPGRLIATVSGRSDELLNRFTMTGGFYPLTSSGDLVVFDTSTGKNGSSNPHPNQGNHIGGFSTTKGQWSWQASPWGSWDVVDAPPQTLGSDLLHVTQSHQPAMCVGYNISLSVIDPATADGRYGANDSAINYAGNKALAVGDDVVYGFHGEFWKNSEANQFLHFRNGLFVGQFGVPNRRVTMHCGVDQGSEALGFWAFAGKAGNSFSPSLTAAPGGQDLVLHHNDESGHGGVHRWRMSGLGTVAQLVGKPLR